MSPAFFENLVVELLERMGYAGEHGAGTRLGKTGDGGVDGVIRQDRLGLDMVYVQAKRWENNVGSSELFSFSGSLDAFRTDKGVFLTTSRFTQAARDFVSRSSKRIVLVDGETLTEFMYELGLGVVPTRSFELKRIDPGYFAEEG